MGGRGGCLQVLEKGGAVPRPRGDPYLIAGVGFRFSGLTAQDFIGVNTTLPQVQQELLNLFSSETILVGHSLESDFKALKVSTPFTFVL